MVWNAGYLLFGGRYIIERKLGEGGIGITYLARTQRGERRVIKTLKENILNNPAWKPHQAKLKQDFRDEAVRLAVCRHPHIVQIETIFDEFDLPCMVMEYIEGEDLGKCLERMGVLPEADALLYMRQIGDALKVIHRKGLLHRDIKPRNIMIRNGKSEAVLIDFGIAREFIPNVVQRHTVYRTPGFAPPEQYELEAPRGEYIDVYGLAATLYSLLTNFIPTSADDRRNNIPLIPPQHFNPNISDRVNKAIILGMELQPIYRPQSIQQWLDLLGVGDSLTSLSPTLTSTPQQKFSTPIALPERWQCVHTLKSHSSMVHSVVISPDGQLIGSGSGDNTIKLWQPDTGRLLRTLGRWFDGHSSMVQTLSFSPDGQLLASGSWDDTIKLWMLSTGRAIRTIIAHSSWVNSVAFSPDGNLLASGGANSTIKIWQVHTGQEIRTLTGHSDSVCSVTFSPDGEILVSGSADYTIKLWQVSTGREIRTLTGHSFFVNSVTLSWDGKILASGSSDNKIKLWQVSTGKEIRTLAGHTNPVSSLAFNPIPPIAFDTGGLRGTMASGSWDNTIKIWELNAGNEICTLNEHSNYVRSIAFSPDGQTLVSASDDDTIKIWQRG
jgi:serine/threonine protein kinase